MNEISKIHVTPEEFIYQLEKSLEACGNADDRGTVYFEMHRWQAYVKSWPPILDENGGL